MIVSKVVMLYGVIWIIFDYNLPQEKEKNPIDFLKYHIIKYIVVCIIMNYGKICRKNH